MRPVDFSQQHKELYHATRRVQEVTAERGVFLAVDGQGAPGGPEFHQALEHLYTVAYTLKAQLKAAGTGDFKVPKLECLWFVDDPQRTGPSQWKWRALLRVPQSVTPAHLKAARKAVAERKGWDLRDVRRVSWREGRALQLLHVGPYDAVAPAYQALGEAAAHSHYRVRGPAHEVYLNDPQRTAPDKLRTIVRLPISHPRPAYAAGPSGF